MEQLNKIKKEKKVQEGQERRWNQYTFFQLWGIFIVVAAALLFKVDVVVSVGIGSFLLKLSGVFIFKKQRMFIEVFSIFCGVITFIILISIGITLPTSVFWSGFAVLISGMMALGVKFTK